MDFGRLMCTWVSLDSPTFRPFGMDVVSLQLIHVSLTKILLHWDLRWVWWLILACPISMGSIVLSLDGNQPLRPELHPPSVELTVT